MRLLTTLLISCVLPAFTQASEEEDAVAAVQRLFDGMAAHDAQRIRSLMLPDARLYSVRDKAPPSSRTADEFVTQIAASNNNLLERFTRRANILIRGRIAQVWGEYEFLRDGKFTHCGVDSVSLFKTAEGWKIAAITYTVETTGCGGR
jgi:hypothetical protein